MLWKPDVHIREGRHGLTPSHLCCPPHKHSRADALKAVISRTVKSGCSHSDPLKDSRAAWRYLISTDFSGYPASPGRPGPRCFPHQYQRLLPLITPAP